MIFCMSLHVLSQMCSAWSGSWHWRDGENLETCIQLIMLNDWMGAHMSPGTVAV